MAEADRRNQAELGLDPKAAMIIVMRSMGFAQREMAYPPTDEQQAVLDAFGHGDHLVVEAGAGTGKTSTLRFIGRDAMAAGSRKGVAIAYNKAIATDMQQSFPPNVVCSTAHSLAFRAVGRQYARRLDSPRLNSRLIAQRLGIDEDLKIGEKSIAPAQLARIVMDTVGAFCRCAEDAPRHWMVPTPDGITGDAIDALIEAAMPLAAVAWADLSEPTGDLMKFDHDHYLKLWQLSRPHINADFIMLDEAQDANPVISAVFNAQTHAQRILVGDENQAIYGWNGAVNAMRKFQGTRLKLTQSSGSGRQARRRRTSGWSF